EGYRLIWKGTILNWCEMQIKIFLNKRKNYTTINTFFTKWLLKYTPDAVGQQRQENNLTRERIQKNIKLQAALKGLAAQRNSACAAIAGSWHRHLHATDKAAARFHMSSVNGTVSNMLYNVRSCKVLVWQEAFKFQRKSDLPDGSCTHLFNSGRG
ncbi:hypothetical protein ATANTOWER_026650, partial [Ataeniobius toweri]|nr:hypothetical protein [Ataeniobius toweri]